MGDITPPYFVAIGAAGGEGLEDIANLLRILAKAVHECRTTDGRKVFGAAIDSDVATASVRALLSAANNVG
jgi:LeuA allosteric (dimerisation) domain